MDARNISKEEQQSYYIEALKSIETNIECLTDIAQKHDKDEAKRFERLIKRDLKKIKMFN